MKRAIAIALSLAAAGCMEVEEEFTLNPDGSGKVVLQWVGVPFDLKEASDADPDGRVMDLVRAQLEKCGGIECWKDVTWILRDDGKIVFKGTAYFRDLAKLKLELPGVTSPLQRVSLVKGADGSLTLVQMVEKSEKAKPAPPADEAAMKKRIRSERLKWQGTKPLITALIGGFSVKTVVHLPSAVATTTCFKKISENSVALTLDGGKLVKALDEFMLDDKRLVAEVAKGFSVDQDLPVEEVLSEKLFGEKGPIRVTMSGEARLLVDFDQELTVEVRKAYAKVCETLGVVERPPEALPPTPQVIRPVNELTRESFEFDVTRSRVVRGPEEGAERAYEELGKALSNESYRYAIETRRSSSRGGSGRGLVRLHDEGDAILEFELAPADSGTRLCVKQRKVSDVTMEFESSNLSALLVRGEFGVALTLIRNGSAFAKTWPSMTEALRQNPAEFAEILAAAGSLPIGFAPTRADGRVLQLALRWDNELFDEERKTAARRVERLAEDDVAVREAATRELTEWLAHSDLRRTRWLLAQLEAARGDEVISRLQKIAATQEAEVAVVNLVKAQGLHRDLEYFGAFLDASDKELVAAARGRLKELVATDFKSRAEFEAWHARRLKD